MDTLKNSHRYSQFLDKFLAKFLRHRISYSPLSRSRKPTLPTNGPTPWKLSARPAAASLGLSGLSALSQTMKITSDSQSLASGLGGRGICKNTWYFAFNLQASLAALASAAGVASQLESVASSQYRKHRLTTVSIISFSSSADGSPEIRGFISGGSMWQRTAQNQRARCVGWYYHGSQTCTNHKPINQFCHQLSRWQRKVFFYLSLLKHICFK